MCTYLQWIEFSDLVDFCESIFFINNIPEPTCVTSTMKNLIDVALTSNQERFSTSRALQFDLRSKEEQTTAPKATIC